MADSVTENVGAVVPTGTVRYEFTVRPFGMLDWSGKATVHEQHLLGMPL